MVEVQEAHFVDPSIVEEDVLTQQPLFMGNQSIISTNNPSKKFHPQHRPPNVGRYQPTTTCTTITQRPNDLNPMNIEFNA